MRRWSQVSADRDGLVEFGILAALMILFVAAGGGSRGDIIAQLFVRVGAVLAVVLLALVGRRPDFATVRAPLLFVLAAATLLVLQLLPLPPGLWHELPGRSVFVDGARAAGMADSWRPFTLSPDGTINALLSLLAPLSLLIAYAFLPSDRRGATLPLLLVLIALSALIGLLQVSSGLGGSPILNDNRGDISGVFANRNHQALFLAAGILVTFIWCFEKLGHPARLWIGGWLIVFLILMILATGSRAGLALAILALGLGIFLSRKASKHLVRRLSRPALWAVVVGGAAALSFLVLASIHSNRALSLVRATETDVGSERRAETFPVLWRLVQDMMPWGSGFGTFDPVYRSREPFETLSPAYFNHAHNDYVEVLIEGGVPGILLLLAMVFWWVGRSWRIWRGSSSAEGMRARAGSSILLFVGLASVVDYPIRTPLIMGLVALAACWMSSEPAKRAFTAQT